MTEPQFNLGGFSGQKLFWIKQIHNYAQWSAHAHFSQQLFHDQLAC